MAGEYGVNINLRVKGQSGLDRLKQKVNELSASVDKIRGIDIMNPRNVGGKGGKADRNQIKKYRKDMEDLVKTVNKSKGAFGKTANQQMAAAEALQEYANNLKIGTKEHKAAIAATEKQVKAINSETTAIDKNNKMQKKNRDLASRIGGMFGKRKGKGGGGGDGALSSALVSGAFPLLFGQGPLGGLFGGLGGFVGTKMGGQMGGFAGGLVATAVLQQITTAVQGLNELGRALEPFTLNIDKINQSIGLANTPTGEYLKLLEETEGTQAAFNAAMVEMEKVVGKDGVKALKDFGEGTKQLQSVFSRFLTQVAAFAAKALNFATASSTETDPNKITGFRRASLLSDAKQNTDARLKPLFEKLGGRMTDKDRKEIQNKIIAIQLEKEQNDLLKLQKLRYDQITKSVEKKNEFLLEATQLGQREAGIQEKLREFDEQAKKAKGGILDITSKQHQEERKIYEDALRLQEELQRISNLYQGIASTIKTGVVDAIDGAIKGTMTLGEVARSVFGSIQRQLIDFGATSILRSLPVIGGFFANGGVTKPNKSYIVGERGPELFTPGVTGRVTPNHEMGGGSTNVVVNVDASGSSVEGDEQRGRELGRLISVAVQSELLEQKRPGGLLA